MVWVPTIPLYFLDRFVVMSVISTFSSVLQTFVFLATFPNLPCNFSLGFQTLKMLNVCDYKSFTFRMTITTHLSFNHQYCHKSLLYTTNIT